MKKLKLTLIGLISMLTISTANAQALEEGDIIIDAYYGFPNLYKTVFRAAYAGSGQEINLEVGGIGPLGVRGEYMIADQFGVGLDIGFSNTKISYEEKSYANESNNYEYNFDTRKIGVMATFNYHFVKNSDNFDAYVMAGAGYGNRTFNYTSTEPGYEIATFSSPFPIAARIGVGMRYFFSENFGASLAMGFGQGGLLNAGISLKL
ncbi:hypothetical protein ERX46_17010 [Brumimicrobium glaciale]|uniref:Outer membrane protein beta-barrel domain-containing protein n=1 Tax=Brumimicrobium glaciale TaxID=200475 RepID=A0A4Q4KDY2_9FLAO|nr:outer membrane beta-barrel protein [Brumimicrobium glaciale]RYM30780.1 hypothetical protein ERX46_17010 [Brumimicrobium glaciale]